MAKDSFPPELRTASIVNRWSIVFTTQEDNVAMHSYFVTMYAYIIADLIKWGGPRHSLMLNALAHDLDETVTGDIVSPVKSQIIDNERMDEFVRGQMYGRLPGVMKVVDQASLDLTVEEMEEMELIIKAADRLDALLFLIMEKRRGNTVVEELIKSAHALLEAAWRGLS